MRAFRDTRLQLFILRRALRASTRSVISVAVPNHRVIVPSGVATGIARILNQQYAPSPTQSRLGVEYAAFRERGSPRRFQRLPIQVVNDVEPSPPEMVDDRGTGVALPLWIEVVASAVGTACPHGAASSRERGFRFRGGGSAAIRSVTSRQIVVTKIRSAC